MEAFKNMVEFLSNLNPATVAGVRVFMERGEIHVEVCESGFMWSSEKHVGFVESHVYVYRNETKIHEDVPEPFNLDNLTLDELEFVMEKLNEGEEPEKVELP